MSNFVNRVFVREVKGDVPGHEFHGNQYTSGEGGGPSFPNRLNQIADRVKSKINRSEIEDAVRAVRSGKVSPLAEAQRLVRDTGIPDSDFQALASYLDSEKQAVKK